MRKYHGETERVATEPLLPLALCFIMQFYYTLDQGCPTQLHNWAKLFVSIPKRAAELLIT